MSHSDDFIKIKEDLSSLSFEGIYRKFRKPILNYVSRTVKNEDLAEELTQEIFLKAFKYQETYRDQFSISTWLWSIARNTIIDWKRKSRPAYEASAFVIRNHEHFDIEQAPDQTINCEDRIIKTEIRDAIFEITKNLTEMQKQVILLRIIDQLSYQEIAQKLNLSLSAVKCLFHRAKTSLSTQANANQCSEIF